MASSEECHDLEREIELLKLRKSAAKTQLTNARRGLLVLVDVDTRPVPDKATVLKAVSLLQGAMDELAGVTRTLASYVQQTPDCLGELRKLSEDAEQTEEKYTSAMERSADFCRQYSSFVTPSTRFGSPSRKTQIYKLQALIPG
eukprot:scpid107890/ scgid22767/ 